VIPAWVIKRAGEFLCSKCHKSFHSVDAVRGHRRACGRGSPLSQGRGGHDHLQIVLDKSGAITITIREPYHGYSYGQLKKDIS
jgi:hypothetical protein